MDVTTIVSVMNTVVSQAAENPAQTGITGAAIIKAAQVLGAGISMGFGAIGAGAGEGYAAGHACEAIGRAPEQSGLITRTMLIGQAVAESTAIYGLVIALLILYAV